MMRLNKIFFHYSVCHGHEFILVMKVMDLNGEVFFLHLLFWDPKI